MWKSGIVVLSLSGLALVGCSSSGTPEGSKPTVSLPAVGAVLPRTQGTSVPQKLDPCTLFTAPEAAKLMTPGATVTRSSGGGVGSLLCVYTGGKSTGAEIAVKIDASPADAHNEFPNWVQPIPGTAAGLTRNSVPALGEEATWTRNSNVNAGIFVQRGNALVKIGAYPPPPLAALKAAAKVALSRIKP